MLDPWGEVMSDMGQSGGHPDWDWSHIIAILGAIESGHTQSRLRAVLISNLKGGSLCQQTASDYSKKESDKISIVWLCTVSLTGSVTTSDLRLSYLMQILTLTPSILTFNRNIFTIKVIICYSVQTDTKMILSHSVHKYLAESLRYKVPSYGYLLHFIA